jgi:hypothetical protein
MPTRDREPTPNRKILEQGETLTLVIRTIKIATIMASNDRGRTTI